MAKKKFYYNNKNKQKLGQNEVNNLLKDIKSKYPEEKLKLTMLELGIKDETIALLSKNNIETAFDLVKRTQKEIYKVQGLNKRVYFELSDALKKFGMSFRVEEIKTNSEIEAEENAEKQPLNKKKDTVDSKKAKETQKLVDVKKDKKFNFEDRRDVKAVKEQPKKNNNVENERTLPKLTTPLPVSQWKKIQKNGKWGFFDGIKTVVPAMYDEVFGFRENLASVELDEKCGFIDSSNNIVIPLDYETAFSFSEDVASVSKNGKYGYINKDNEEIIPFIYDAATAFENGEAKVKKDNKWGTIQKDGTVKWI